MRKRIIARWQTLTIKKKISFFTQLVFVIIGLLVLFDVWVLRFPVLDFNAILDENLECGELVQKIEEEKMLFEDYIKAPDDELLRQLKAAMKETGDAVDRLHYDYADIGERRYNKTWTIRNFYENYVEKRNRILENRDIDDYIVKLYEVYEMQDYLQKYARELMNYTLEDGNALYQQRIPGLVQIPAIMFGLGAILMLSTIKQADLMNRNIVEPILELARASKRIARNDFSGNDIQTESKDEIGELVVAFNKMKYATGEYIQALEERRETLDLLHEEELKRLMAEKHLEYARFELLKNQVNPHFLFNTLNVIGGMANLEDAKTTEKMIESLSALFRYNLKTTEPEVLLAQELKVVRDYMYLQGMRFGNRICYKISCEVDEREVRVPIYTFQPLMENAIIHGLSKKEEGGIIRIYIKECEGNILILIGDTGKGMTEEALRTLRKDLKEGRNNGVGLGNVYKRVTEMYFGSEVEVFSKIDCGTVIKIRIVRG